MRASVKPHALLLAAGLGQRFRKSAGNPAAEKLLHVVETRAGWMPMGIAAASALRAAGLEVTVVVRHHSPASFAFASSHFETLEAPEAHLGMAHSLAAGVARIPSPGGWMVALADMPFIAPTSIAHIATLLADAGDAPRIVVPTHAGERGHPVAFSAHFGSELAALSGDWGARSVIDANRQSLLSIELADPGILRDIDAV